MALKENEVDFVECNGVQKKFADTFAREAINGTQASITEIENKLTPIIPKANGAIQNVVGDDTINVGVSEKKEAQLHANIDAMLKKQVVTVNIDENGNWECPTWSSTGTIQDQTAPRLFNNVSIKIPTAFAGKIVSAMITFWTVTLKIGNLVIDNHGSSLQLIFDKTITNVYGAYEITIWYIETN